MEPRFNTSFIPKQSLSQNAPAARPRVNNSAGPRSWGTLLAFVVFVISLTVSAGLLGYRWYLANDIENKLQTLDTERQAFQPALIKELVRLDARINSAQAIVDRHVAPSRLFALLEETTLTSVRFTGLTYANVGNSQVALSLSGAARTFESVALQSDVFGSNQYLRNPVFSDIDINEAGMVIFEVDARVAPELLEYRDTVVAAPGTSVPPRESQNASTVSPAASTADEEQPVSDTAPQSGGGAGGTQGTQTGGGSGSVTAPPPPGALPGQ